MGDLAFDVERDRAALAVGVAARPAGAPVRRDALLAALDRGAAKSMVVVVAPPGYGKTTAIGQWVDRDPRVTCWLTLDDADRDPDHFLARLGAALAAGGVVDDAGHPMPDAPAMTDALPRLGVAIEQAPSPFVLVLDEVDHVLAEPAAHTIVRVVARRLPPGAQIVLVARTSTPLPIGALTTRGDVLRLGIDDLAMSAREAGDVLRAAGFDVGPEAVEELVRRTAGWPAILALAGNALGLAGDVVATVSMFGGDDPLVAGYVEDRVLAPMAESELRVLRAGSILDELTGESCDALVEAPGSATVLAELAHRTSLVRPVDRAATAYRLHPIVGEVLRSQLTREGAASVRRLHARASAVAEGRGDLRGAVRHALTAGDRTRAAGLVWRALPAALAENAVDEYRGWLTSWTDAELAADPVLCCAAAWRDLVVGDPADVPRWIDAARRGAEDLVLPDGTPLRSALALLRATVARDGLCRMREDARLAVELDRRDDPLLAVALTMEAAALRLLGDADGARSLLEDAADLAAILVPVIRAHALALLALLAMDDDRFADAEHLAAQAVEAVERAEASERPTVALVYAVRAALTARQGMSREAQADAERCLRLVQALVGVMPAFAVEARILLALACSQLGDYRTARLLIHEADHLLRAFPDAGSLGERLETVRGQIDTAKVPVGLVASRLTPAELRVLRLLPTHYSFPEIADALFVSRHTVKTHAVSVYHKLGVSSRRDAVERARELGLLE